MEGWKSFFSGPFLHLHNPPKTTWSSTDVRFRHSAAEIGLIAISQLSVAGEGCDR